MNLYIDQQLSELRQRETIRNNWQRQLVKTALYCCAEASSSLFRRIKLALEIQLANLCCFNTE